jgi:O-methyltransferase
MEGSSDVTSELFATPRLVTNIDECHFYHSMDLPEYGPVDGEWDLRPGIDQYLGSVDLTGKRVLEIGPASGYVTMEMERRGASVVSVELPASDSAFNEFFPVAGIDVPAMRAERIRNLQRLQNSYWLVHRVFDLSAQVHYGYPNPHPDGLGEFDVAFLGCVLLHCPNPLGVVLSCAKHTRETIVITDTRSALPDAIDRQGFPICILNPSVENPQVDTWWTFSPEFFERALRVVGFDKVAVTYHEQRFVPSGTLQPLFTVVGTR